MAQDETLKLQFTVFDDAEKRDVQPHQTFLRFYDEKTDEEGIVPIKVGRDGKARFSLVGVGSVRTFMSFGRS